MQRAAIYARYSTDLQNPRSCTDQIALCSQYAERNGLAVTHIYQDSARSGATMFGRPGLAELMNAAQTRAFDVVIVEAADRLSRDMEDLAHIHKRLTFKQIALFAVNEGRVDTIIVGLRGIVGQLFREDGVKKIRRGMAGVVRDGRSAGGRAYGYRPKNGEPGQLEIVPEEAKTILRIFNEFATGRSPRDIAGALNREGVPPPRGKLWNASSINGNLSRGNGILLNPIYGGEIIWNRVRMDRDPTTGKRVSRVNAESEWQTSPAEHLRIVPAELFDAVQTRKRAASSGRHGPIVKRQRLLSGLLRCGVCGGGMSICDSGGGRARIRIRCSSSRESGACGNRRKFPLREIERTVIEGMMRVHREPFFLDQFWTDFNAARLEEHREALAAKETVERELDAVKCKITRLVDAIADGAVPRDEARQRTERLQVEKMQAEARLAACASPKLLEPLNPTAFVDQLLYWAYEYEQVLDALEDGGCPDEWNKIRRLVETVVVHPYPDGDWKIELNGGLRKMLEIIAERDGKIGGLHLDQISKRLIKNGVFEW